jgi:hypothetical protein
VAYGLDYLVTSNCSHLANAVVIRRLAALNAEAGFKSPSILTPHELLGDL